MTTVSPTKARRNLTALLKKAAAGEKIGILYAGNVFVFRESKTTTISRTSRKSVG